MTGLYERKAKSQKKHPCSTSSQAAFRPSAQPPSQKPGWKGPSYMHKKPKPYRPSPASATSTQSTIQEQYLSQKVQQTLLNIFKTTFPSSQDFDALKPVLQEIKNALYERDFERAFGEERYLEAYAVRWSPSRALGYGNLLAWVVEEVCASDEWCKMLFESGRKVVKKGGVTKVVCFGGGPAEIMAFAGMLRYLRPDLVDSKRESEDETNDDETDKTTRNIDKLSISASEERQHENTLLSLNLVDSAPWSRQVQSLETSITTPPPLSAYASASAKAANHAYLPSGTMTTNFTQLDVLDLSLSSLKEMIGPFPSLITLFFTLNELYTTSIPRTTKFLLELTLATPKGTVLLVVDSPGSYSEMAIKKTAPRSEDATATADDNVEEEKEDAPPMKKYPMHWLLDHALLGDGKKGADGKQTPPMWEKVVGEESRWFRLEEGLKYPVCLENMRFQVHLFRRL